jgi:hypothetical protein
LANESELGAGVPSYKDVEGDVEASVEMKGINVE